MSRVQLVNTLALAHPCLLAGPEGVGPFHCPAEPINTMRCCHALDPGMPTMSSTVFDFPPQPSCFRRPDQITTPVAVSPIVRCIPARHLSRPHAAHSIRRYHDGKAATTLGRGAIRRRVVAIASQGAPMAIRVQKGGASGDWQRASWHDAGLLLAAHSSDAVLPCLRSSEVRLGRRFPLVG